jgi:hypothetical protein
MNAAVTFVLLALAGPAPEKPIAVNPEAVESFRPTSCPYKAAGSECVYIQYRGTGGITVAGTFDEIATKLTG